MKMKTIICTLIVAALSLPVLAADADLAVIVNKSNTISNVTKSQLRKLVLGEQPSWPGGFKVVVVLLQPGTPERDGVLRSICRMSEDDYNQHQMHANFSGETNTAPKVVNSVAAARQGGGEHPGCHRVSTPRRYQGFCQDDHSRGPFGRPARLQDQGRQIIRPTGLWRNIYEAYDTK